MRRSPARSLITLIALATAAASAACGSDSPTAPSNVAPVDLNAVVGQLSVNTVNIVPGATTLLGVPVVIAAPAINAAACPYSASTQGFICPTQTAAGLTFDLSYFLADAQGKSQSQFGPTTTASVRTVGNTKGTVAIPTVNGATGSVALTDHSDVTMSGLLAVNHTLNGTSASHYDVTLTGTTASHSAVDVTTVTSNVVFSTAASATAYPLSGTVTNDTRTVTSIGALPPLSATIHAVLTFDGTSTPTIVVTAGGRTATCKISLAGGSAPSCL